MNSLKNRLFTILLASTIFGAGFAAFTHTHGSADGADALSACSCVAHQAGTPAGPVDPCDHSDDCQLCKFLSSFGWLDGSQVDVQAEAISYSHVFYDTSLSSLDPWRAFQGRAPPLV